MAGSRLAAVPLAAVLCGSSGLVLAGCGASSPPASPAVTVTVTASAPTVTITAGAASPGVTGSAVASGTQGCPSANAVSRAAGASYLGPTANTAAGALNCSYEANSGFLQISLGPATSPASDLQQTAASQAQAQGGEKLESVSGIGDAAYLFTIKGPGPDARELIVQSGSSDVTILGARSTEQLKAIARVALGS